MIFAAYKGPHGIVGAHLCDEDHSFKSDTAHKGDWLITDMDGQLRIVAAPYFSENYSQVFPRPVDGEREIIKAGPKVVA